MRSQSPFSQENLFKQIQFNIQSLHTYMEKISKKANKKKLLKILIFFQSLNSKLLLKIMDQTFFSEVLAAQTNLLQVQLILNSLKMIQMTLLPNLIRYYRNKTSLSSKISFKPMFKLLGKIVLYLSNLTSLRHNKVSKQINL